MQSNGFKIPKLTGKFGSYSRNFTQKLILYKNKIVFYWHSNRSRGQKLCSMSRYKDHLNKRITCKQQADFWVRLVGSESRPKFETILKVKSLVNT